VSFEPSYLTTTTDHNGRFHFGDLETSTGSRFFLTSEKLGYVPHRPAYYYGEVDYFGAEPPPRSYSLPAALYRTTEDRRETLGVFELSQGEIARTTITLERAGVLEGTLTLRTRSGLSPFAEGVGLRKKLDPASAARFGKSSLPIAWIQPDGEGRFEVTGLAPGDGYYFRLSPSGYAGGETTSITITADQTTTFDHVFDATNQTGVAGSVRFGGVPASSLTGRVLMRQLAPSGGFKAAACVSPIANGEYSCLGLQEGAWTIRALAFNAHDVQYEKETTISLSDGQTLSLDLDLESALSEEQ
jgi:hypothetical protein